MKKAFLLMLLAFLACSTTFAQGGKEKTSDLTAKVPVDRKVRIGHLDNGLTYYIRANKKPENRIQFRMVTNAGSILEDESQRGLAHFCEHMAFNGTEPYPHNTMIDELQKNGIEFGRGINAWTSFDETVYYVDMPADKANMVEMGFKILDGWMGKLTFDPQELEDERGVIHEEWRGNLGASDRLREKTWPTMLKGSRYAERLPIGLESVIMGFKRDDIVRFYKDWYRPDMQAVVIVGDFEAAGMTVDQVEAKIKEVYGKTPKSVDPKARPEYDIPANVEPLIAIATDKEATNTTLQFFWKHSKAPQGTVGDYRQSLVRQLINGMLTSRFNELCEKATAPMMMADAGYTSFLGRSCDAFMVYAMPKEGRINDAAMMLLTEMRRVDQHGFLQAELDRQKEDLISNYTRMAKEENKTQNNSFAQEYTNNFLEGEVIPGIRQEWKYAKEFVPTITLEEVNNMVKGWITDDNMVFYLTAPEKPGFKVLNEKEALKIIKKAKKAKVTPWVDNYKDEPFYAKEVKAATPSVSKENTALGYTEYTCPNGIRFVVKKTNYKADEIQISSYAMGGTSLYDDHESYAAAIASTFIDDAGIGNFSSSQLEKKLKGTNLGLVPEMNDITQGFSGSCSPKDLEMTLQYLNLFYEAPRKDQESFDKNIETMRNQVKFIGENPQYVFLNKFYKTAYPNDKRRVLIPSEELLNSLKLDRVYEIYKERFNDASNQTFFFVGNISDADISLIAKYLNNLPATGKQKNETYKVRESKFAEGIQRAEAVKGTDNQGAIIIYGESEGFDPSKKNKMAVQQLGDAMSITALEIIREKMGGTYSPSVNVSYEILPTSKVSWMFYINCNPEQSKEIEEAVFGILNQYINNGVDSVTLGKVQEQMIVNRESAMQNNGFWMAQIQGSYIYNENRDDINNYANLVKSITSDDIKAIAQQFINLKNYVVVTLKPEETK